MIDKIKSDLMSGKTLFKTPRGFNIKVEVKSSGLGGRYQAFIKTPSFNTRVETPRTVKVEGPLTFYARLAPKLVEIMRNVEFYEINRRLNINSVYGKIGGIKSGELTVICAGDGVGKSVFGDRNVR